uniref:Uncharacterized protein n=1 Tax=Lactuca sativa TaxID=4236 RepID=A0A9R1WYU0_LACSA|nr:hypothetical protein LSAT_V11C800399890 [Lactuca sativa]
MVYTTTLIVKLCNFICMMYGSTSLIVKPICIKPSAQEDYSTIDVYQFELVKKAGLHPSKYDGETNAFESSIIPTDKESNMLMLGKGLYCVNYW